MTDPKPASPDLDKALEADRQISEDLEDRLARLEREVAPHPPRPDHAHDGGIL